MARPSLSSAPVLQQEAMSSALDGGPSGRAGNETPPGMPRRAALDGPGQLEITWRPKLQSTLLKVTDAYCNEDFLDMHLLSVRKLTARSIEQGKIAKRVNMVHRMSETSSVDGSHSYGITGNITDRTMDLVKLLSTLDQFKLRNSLNAPAPEKSTSKQALEVTDGGESSSEEGSEEGELPGGLSNRGGTEELLQRPWQLRLLQMEQQQHRMQQQQVAEGQGPAPDAPCSPNWQGEAEGQLGGGCPAALQSSSPSPSPTAPQHLHLHPLPEPGGSIHGMEGAKGPHSKLPATVHSLRLLSSPDARHLLASIAAAKKQPDELTLESLNRAQKLPLYPPKTQARASSCSPIDPHPHQDFKQPVCPQEHAAHNPLQQLVAASQASQGGMALPAEATFHHPLSAVAVDAAGGNPQGSTGAAEPCAPPKQNDEASGSLLPPSAATPSSPDHHHHHQQQQQQIPCLMPSLVTEAASVQAEGAALPAAEAVAGSPQAVAAALPGSETGALPQAEAAAALPQTETALPGCETKASPTAEAAAAHAAEGDLSEAIAPSPANASKRTSTMPDVDIPDSRASRKSSKKSKGGNAPGKSKGRSSRSKSPGKRSKSPSKGGKSPRKGSKSPSKRGSSTPKSKMKGAASRTSSRPASSPTRASAGAQNGASRRMGTASKSERGLNGDSCEAEGPQLKGVLKPMEREAIGANVVDLEDPGYLKHEAARLQGLHLHAFAKRNPAGFNENEAACEVAAYREAARRGRYVLAIAQDLPGDKKGERALWSAMQELHFRRPFLVMPELPSSSSSSSSSSRAAAIQSVAWQQEQQDQDSGQGNEPPLSQGARLQARLRAHEVAAGRRAAWAAAAASMHSGSMYGALHGSSHDAGPDSEHTRWMDSAPHAEPFPHPVGGSHLSTGSFTERGGQANPRASPGSSAGGGGGGQAQAGRQVVGVSQDGPGSRGGDKASGQKVDGQKAGGQKAGSEAGTKMGGGPHARRDGQHAGAASKSGGGTPGKNAESGAAEPMNAWGEAGMGVDVGGDAELLPSVPQSHQKQPPAKKAEGVDAQGGPQQQQQQQQQQHVNLQPTDCAQEADDPHTLPLQASPSIVSVRGSARWQDGSQPSTSGGQAASSRRSQVPTTGRGPSTSGGPRRSSEMHKAGMLGSLTRQNGQWQRSKRQSSSTFESRRRASSVTPLEEEEEEEESPPGWSAQEHSLFAPRAKSSDSRDLLDNPECRQKQLDLDWQRLVTRHPFRYFMSKEARPPPLIELPPPPEEDLEAEGLSFTFQRLMALHAASKADTSHPSEDTPPNPTHHTTTTTSATNPLPTSPDPEVQPLTKTGAKDTSVSSSSKLRPTPSPPPAHTPMHTRTRSPHGKSSSHRGTSGSPLPEVGANGSSASLRRATLAQQQQQQRRQQQGSPLGSAGSARPRTGSPGQRQASAPKLPKLPFAAERVQQVCTQAVQQKPALAWHTESWLQVQEQAPEWTPGQTLPRMQAATRQQKRTASAPPSSLLPPVAAQPLDEASQEQQKQAEKLEQALSLLQKTLAQRHPLLLAIFGSYALVLRQQHGGPDPGLMLPYSAWVALLEDCRLIDAQRPGPKDKEFLGAFKASCSGKYPLSPQAPASDMLMRFEYFEALIRVAVAKYVKPGQCREVHEALGTLISEHLQGHLPADMRQDPNTFRANLLYTPCIDATLRRAAPMLYALHASACASRRTTFLKLDGWIELLQSCGVIGFHVGVSIPDAASIFSSSQLLVVDELKHHWRVCGLDALDFMEAVCRVATLLDPPARPELQRRLRECLGVTPEHILTIMAGNPYYTYYQKLAFQPHNFKWEGPDAGAHASDTHHQLQQLKQLQQPEQPQQDQEPVNHRQQTPVQALRHKLRALLDLIQGSLEAQEQGS